MKKEKEPRLPFKVRLARFMQGRYGQDTLGRFLYFVALILLILNLFFRHYAFYIAEGALLLIWFFRFFSKNRQRRAKENAVFLRFTRALARPLLRAAHRFRDRKTHVYRRCPACRRTLRLPKRSGEHTVVCPVCKNRFSVKIK